MLQVAETPIIAPLTTLQEEEQLFQSSVRQFARERLAPHVREMDEAGKFRSELLREMFQTGLMGVGISEQYGGQGGTFLQAALAIEELANVDPSASVIVDVQNTLVSNAVERWASAEQKQRYLHRLATEIVGSYALSEAGSGSDAFALSTRAARDGSGYRLSGRKLWITNAAEAALFLVFATIDPAAGYRGITCFLIERNMPGFQVGKKEDKLGIRASSTCELILDDVPVGEEQVMGEPGKGYKIAIETLNEGRIGIGAQMLGLAAGALDHALRYARERKQFGKRIGDFQGVQFQLAEMANPSICAPIPMRPSFKVSMAIL
jgi:short-chain 2-methylacyl-CoA dehydrogenase